MDFPECSQMLTTLTQLQCIKVMMMTIIRSWQREWEWECESEWQRERPWMCNNYESFALCRVCWMLDWQLKDGKDTGHGTDRQSGSQAVEKSHWQEGRKRWRHRRHHHQHGMPAGISHMYMRKIKFILREDSGFFACKSIPEIMAGNIDVFNPKTV